jgi:hypothetical protein
MSTIVFHAIPIVAVLLIGSSASGIAQTPLVELDHVYIVVSPGATKEIEALRSAGLTVRPRVARHEGQGTASVSAIFENAYLELLWVDSSVSVRPGNEKMAEWFTGAAAWQRTGRSPIGVGLRRAAGATGPLPVPVQRDSGEWMTPGEVIELLTQDSETLASDLFVVPPSMAVPAWIARLRERAPEWLRHERGGREITLARVHGREAHRPKAFAILEPARVEFVTADAVLLELVVDGGRNAAVTDLRPLLPLVIRR